MMQLTGARLRKSHDALGVLTLQWIQEETWNFRVEISISRACVFQTLIIEVCVSQKAFLDMVQAYRRTVGRAYPQRDPVAVFKVLEECAAPMGTTQVAITRSTGVRTAEVNKIVSRAAEMGWVRLESSRSRSGAKPVFLTELGRQILGEFDRRCAVVCRSAKSKRKCVSAETHTLVGTVFDRQG